MHLVCRSIEPESQKYYTDPFIYFMANGFFPLVFGVKTTERVAVHFHFAVLANRWRKGRPLFLLPAAGISVCPQKHVRDAAAGINLETSSSDIRHSKHVLFCRNLARLAGRPERHT